VSNRKTQTKTRWTREFKLRALSRMEAAADVSALAVALGCRRELLYIWRRKYRSGGAEALERKIGQQQLDLVFFARRCGMSGKHA
jgi:transposase-like protein